MSDITRTRPNADQFDELIRAIKGISGEYYPATAGSIVSAIRSGHADKIPNGSVFKETHAVYGDIYFATRARNQHKVAGDSTRPTITIQPIYLLSSNGGNSAATFQYDRPEAMFAALETAIPSGTVVQFTAAAYDKWTADAFHFTASVDLPVGTMLCLSGYASTLMTSLNVVAYANPKATTALATMAISAGAGDATVNLGAFRLRDELRCAGASRAVDVLLELAVRRIHLTESAQDLRSTGVEVLCDVVPQLLHQRLGFRRRGFRQ